MKVYLVHYGFHTDPKTKEETPMGPVTFRDNEEEAQQIADFLDSKRLDLSYHEYLAAQSNEAMGGSVPRILAAHTDALHDEFLEIMKGQPKYEVTQLDIEGEDEVALLKELEEKRKEEEPQ